MSGARYPCRVEGFHQQLQAGLRAFTNSFQWFRGGLVFKAHRLLYHSTLGLRVTKKKKFRAFTNSSRRFTLNSGIVRSVCSNLCMGTSLIRNCFLLGPYSRPMHRALWWSQGG